MNRESIELFDIGDSEVLLLLYFSLKEVVSIKSNYKLLQAEVNERCFCHLISCELQRNIKYLSEMSPKYVDLEYNRYYITEQEVDSKRGHGLNSIIPDIVIHSREDGENYLAAEVVLKKRSLNPEDKSKLKVYIQNSNLKI